MDFQLTSAYDLELREYIVRQSCTYDLGVPCLLSGYALMTFGVPCLLLGYVLMTFGVPCLVWGYVSACSYDCTCL